MSKKAMMTPLVLIIILLIIIGVTTIAVMYINLKSMVYPTTTQSESQITRLPESVKPSIEQTIASYLREFPVKSEIREKAVGILKEYLGKSGVVFQGTRRVGAGSYDEVFVLLYSGIIYELSISVSGNCIGTCDIYVDLLDVKNQLAKIITSTGQSYITGRYSSLRINFTLPFYQDVGLYSLKLDNYHSIFTSKNVYITLRAYYPSYAFDDDYFKLFSIGHWVSTNIRYVSDPLIENEYIAPPNETLRVGAGDCDDYAVLLSTLYRSVGLNSFVGLIDTDGNLRADHAVALVYFNKNATEIGINLQKWASVLGIKIDDITYFTSKTDEGIYVVVDPPMSLDKNNPWSVYQDPYKLIKIIGPS
jgi:predicted transglutaminase-like cysteine proteinase